MRVESSHRMTLDIEARIKAQVDLPSPSGVASQVISLARDPNIQITKVAEAISRDPAMTAKLLRIANSAFYAQRRPSSNIRQALVIIGLNAALTLALSFSLVSGLRAVKPNGIDYKRFWRRTLLAATASRACAEVCRLGGEEELFLSGLLQDVAILAIDRASATFYDHLPPDSSHTAMMEYERQQLGKDHAAYSAMLLREWKLPERLCEAVELSHQSKGVGSNPELTKAGRCVAFSSELADAVLSKDRSASLGGVANRARLALGIRDEQFTEIVTRLLKLIPEAEELFETSIIDPQDAEILMAQSRELLTLRNLQALQEMNALRETAGILLSKTEELEDANRRDPLTGVLNRQWLDRMIEREFTQAVMFGRALSVALIDMDHFRTVNDTFGSQAGDQVIKAAAHAMQGNVRGSDLLGRYSGTEFMVIFPGTDKEIARRACDRIVTMMQKLEHVVGASRVTVTVSAGIATLTAQNRFANVSELIAAADHALYAAKLRGRNCVEYFDDVAPSTGQRSSTKQAS
jgi:diguanylate cyclase (GGDEF)-like protein